MLTSMSDAPSIRIETTAKTHFFGGIGTAGDYLDDMQRALIEAGLPGPAIGTKALLPWTGLQDSLPDKLLQVMAVPWLRTGHWPWRLPGAAAVRSGDILIGYSFGGLVAAHIALRQIRATRVILIATPLSAALLSRLRDTLGTAMVEVRDLDAEGDPIHAGMSLPRLVLALPRLCRQYPRMEGHFLYARGGVAAAEARRLLAREIARAVDVDIADRIGPPGSERLDPSR